MIGVAIALLAATALLPAVSAGTRHRLALGAHPRSGVVVDAGTVAAMLLLSGASALLGVAGGPAAGTGRVVTVCAATAAAVTGGGFVVRLVLRTGGVIGQNPTPSDGPLRGGRVIGYLERAAVAGTLLAGWPEGLAVILAVKSLARYPELRAPQASEQFIMGTFASVLWAAGMSGVGYLLLH
ncbi:hypothetical protein AAFP30_12815 [Gordonia sp. CPCC 205515]|uniref:hypothetical protein n=1 Tax=Gordonia sp. CPCC 205515 TaxID=3140791 RepID=UPI003AF38BEB